MLICVNLIVKKLFSSNLAQKDFGIMIRILSGYSWWVKWVPVLLGTSGVFSGIGVAPTPAMSCSRCRKLWEKRCKRSLWRGLPSTSVDQFFFLCHVPVSFTQLLHNSYLWSFETHRIRPVPDLSVQLDSFCTQQLISSLQPARSS